MIDVLKQYRPIVTSVRLTQELEKRMEEIRRKNEKRKSLLLEVIEQLKPQLEYFKEEEEQIGKVLSEATERARMQVRIIGSCPVCSTGELTIVYSRRTKKRFIGCTSYFKGGCETSYPLPQRGIVKSTGKNCSSCGWPIVQLRSGQRRPWKLCFNPNCASKQERRRRIDM